ncbi:hypothetical protein NPIL_116871 [Nephila pilipes]|uniref:Uncharacterized protein n=1 Tax=Nephila pilipes TaxID=299642 RepID=A0A8X6IUY3_NEPPI|nr:hypothetical protein NPIL_116871 [Nephila pilipes]
MITECQSMKVTLKRHAVTQISCRDDLEMAAGVTLKRLHKQRRPSTMIQNLQLVLKNAAKVTSKRLQMQRSLWEKTFNSHRSLNG